MKKRNLLLLIVIAGALGTLTSQVVLSNNSDETAIDSNISKSLRPVPTAQVKLFEQTKQLSFPGSVQAHSRVELAFNVDGQIVESNIVEGGQFKKGDVLARLDKRDFRHSYDAALADTSRLEKEFERVKKLYGQQVVSQAEYDVAKSKQDVALAELRIREKAVQDTVLTAPFDGVVAKRYAENFQHIKAKDHIVSFKDISIIEVVIQMPERLVTLTDSGIASDIRVIFDSDKNKSYQGRLIEHSVQSDPVSRTYDTVIGVNQPKDLNIFPGMTATVFAGITNDFENLKTISSPVADALIIPIEAVLRINGSSYCWVIPENGGSSEKREVETGALRDEGVIITKGLEAGEHVAIAGLHTLYEGLKVRPARLNWEGLDG